MVSLPQLGKALKIGGAVMLVLAASAAAFETATNLGLGMLRESSMRRLQIFDRTLEATIERFHYLPATIAQSPEIRALLEDQDNLALLEAANGYLSRLNGTAVSDELFVVNTEGKSIAASNWWSHVSLVGHSYAIRPYFLESLSSGNAKYYAVGMTTKVAGYFLATRIDGNDGPLGVAVTKINLGEIEAVWWRSGELLGILDANDVAILSTRPDWRYRSLKDVSPEAVAELDKDQRYIGVGVSGQGIVRSLEPWRGTELAILRGEDGKDQGSFLVERLRIPSHGWQLVSFTPLDQLSASAWIAAVVAGFSLSAILIAWTLFGQRQALVRARLEDHDRLEDRVKTRTNELEQANIRLNDEIAERQIAERERRKAQEGLVQAAKMASLGQALAGVAHEVSQPIAALKAHASSARLLARDQGPVLRDVLGSMDQVIVRLSDLTGHLKTFARRENAICIQCDISHVVSNALELSTHLVGKGRLRVDLTTSSSDLMVLGNPIHLEQILINLITNAADAMEHLDDPHLTIDLSAAGNHVSIAVSDIGTGIPAPIRETMFDPFITTKEPGRGLGLGLSISFGLAREMGGDIIFHPAPKAGTTFVLTVPRAAAELETA